MTFEQLEEAYAMSGELTEVCSYLNQLKDRKPYLLLTGNEPDDTIEIKLSHMQAQTMLLTWANELRTKLNALGVHEERK